MSAKRKKRWYSSTVAIGLAALFCFSSVTGEAEASRTVRGHKGNVLQHSRIGRSFSGTDANGYVGISEYNHPTDDFRVASALAYINGWLGGSPEYLSLLERCFASVSPKKVWDGIWAFSLARPAERAAFGAAVIEDITVEGDRIVARLNMPDIWLVMDEKAGHLPETVRQWAFMDALGERAELLGNVPRKTVWIELAADVVGRFKISQADMMDILTGPEQDIRDALLWISEQWKKKSRPYIPAYGRIAGQQVKLNNRTTHLPYDLEMGLAALADGGRPGYEVRTPKPAPKVKKAPKPLKQHRDNDNDK